MLYETAKNKLIESGYLPLIDDSDFQYWIDVKLQGKPIYFYISFLGGSKVVSSGFKIDYLDNTVSSSSVDSALNISRVKR